MILYHKKSNIILPDFDLVFRGFNGLDEMSPMLSVTWHGMYNVCIKSDNYDEIIKRVDSDMYIGYRVYVEVSENMYNYILMHKPSVATLRSKDNMEVFNELVEDRGILFGKGLKDKLYYALPHDYNKITDVLDQLAFKFTGEELTLDQIKEVYPFEDLVWPQRVLSAFLKLNRSRWSLLKKCYDQFDHEMIYYMIRKKLKALVEDKIGYLKSGAGSDYIKSIPQKNLVLLYDIFCTKRTVKDSYILFYIYEKEIMI